VRKKAIDKKKVRTRKSSERSLLASLSLDQAVVRADCRHFEAGIPTQEENMRNSTRPVRTLMTMVAISASFVLTSPASAQDAGAQAAYRDIEQTLGLVPDFFKAFPQSGIAGAWSEFKALQLNPNTKLDNKTKQLIGLAVSAQIPCQYCIYFHAAVARANGATDAEISEAVAMAAMTRHWSTVLNGMEIDLAAFKKETDTVLKLGAEKANSASK
jgi:AhpD family alkylhydroperoxidase